ncbi:MAG: hypothetical protein ACREWG_06985 [Gammaproteobacteria bacterium]
MDMNILKIAGQIAGIGGLSIGVFLLLFRELIRKSIFPKLTKEHAYRLLSLIAVLAWSVALVGIGAWVWVAQSPAVTTNGGVGAGGNVNVNGDIVIEGQRRADP